jgi:hypothetical protein
VEVWRLIATTNEMKLRSPSRFVKLWFGSCVAARIGQEWLWRSSVIGPEVSTPFVEAHHRVSCRLSQLMLMLP